MGSEEQEELEPWENLVYSSEKLLTFGRLWTVRLKLDG